MPRYVKPRAGGWIDDDWDKLWCEEEQPHLPSLTVDDHEAIYTGLVWSTGEPILRAPNPIGFGRDDEW